MKLLRFLPLFSLVSIFVVGCQGNRLARVVRLSIEDGATNLQISLNGNKPSLYTSTRDFRQRIVQLRLQHGDLIILRDWPTAEGSQNAALADWLGRYSLTNKVAVYIYKGARSDAELFNIPVYNWVTPFDNPRSLSTAFFFCNGTALGGGEHGFERMLQLIRKVKNQKILMLGSRYNYDTGFGASECPFEKEQNALDQVLETNDIQQILIHPFF